jgi:hypothetical protein
MPLPLRQIGTVDPGRYGLDDHLSAARLWHRERDNTKDFRSTGSWDVDSAHGLG